MEKPNFEEMFGKCGIYLYLDDIRYENLAIS
jgi:hypothetical protein